MQFQSQVTQKGQVTIPKKIRDRLRIKPNSRVKFLFNEKTNAALITSVSNISDLAEFFGPPPKNKGVSPIKAREYMSKHYGRA